MRNIDKFILHVAHNWRNELNEAYGKAQLQRFIDHFKEDADELNIQVSDDQLKKYIETFDKLRIRGGKFSVDPMTLTLPQLIKLVTSVASDIEDEEEETPDVVYHEGPITIWNGNKDENCLTYGRGGSWCIARGSWAGHRYNEGYSFPTFYIAKNTSLPDNDLISWIVIAVREDGQYVLHNKDNQPHYPKPESFSRLLSQVPWLADIPNIQRILKYQPLTTKEKITQKYTRGNTNMSIREWISSTFNFKKQYLVARSQNLSGDRFPLFSDITNDDFIKKVLPKFPNIADFISVTEGILDPVLLLRNLDNFTPQQRKSITANLHTPVDIKLLKGESLPFDVKILLTKLNKWNLAANERVYVTKDNSTIVKLTLDGDNPKIDLHQEEDDFNNIKITPRTVKYLLGYPELDKLPFNSLFKLVTDGIIDKEFIGKVIEKAKSEENSAIIVKKVEDGEILVDANSFSSYKIKNGNITKIPFTDEEVQTTLGEKSNNTAFQQSAVNIVKQSIEDATNLPPTFDKDAFTSIIKSTPYSKRTFTTSDTDGQQILLAPDGESRFALFTRKAEELYNWSTDQDYGNRGDWRDRDTYNWMDEGAWRSYFDYLRSENKFYEGSRLQQWFRQSQGYDNSKKAWFKAQPPLSPTDQYAIAVTNDNYYVVNKANPRESLKLSDSSKLTKANIPASMAAQLLRATPTAAAQEEPAAATPQAPADQIARRGRPAGIPNAPRDTQPAAGGGDINVSNVMDETGLMAAFNALPRADNRRLNVTDAVRANPNGDRGAARRNNQLGAAGNVGRVISVGPSKIYIIRLANQQIIASINMQPGNRNYILLPGGTVVTLNSPAELMQALQQRNLAEVRHYMVRDYVSNNPHHLDEVRELMKQHEAKRK